MSLAALAAPVRAAQDAPPPLRIVVVEGEDAVNVVQNRTAVAPVVEIRDVNGQPVAGAIVRFAIQGGRATFNGSRALTVTTNAAGRAIATGLTPTGGGALQIGAIASFQGETAALTIAQTNVMTVAQAAQIAGASGASGSSGTAGASSGAAAGGGGGGISATTLGVVGGAVAGGAIVATRVISAAAEEVTYVGTFSGILVNFVVAPGANNVGCRRNELIEGTITLDVAAQDDGSVSGGGSINEKYTVLDVTGNCAPGQVGESQQFGCCRDGTPVGGTKSNLRAGGADTFSNGVTFRHELNGTLNGDTISGTYTFTVVAPFPNQGGSAAFPFILQRQQ